MASLPQQDSNRFAEVALAAENAALSPPPAGVPRTMSSLELLRGGRELRIAHGDEVYRLLLTRTGKLLLQK